MGKLTSANPDPGWMCTVWWKHQPWHTVQQRDIVTKHFESWKKISKRIKTTVIHSSCSVCWTLRSPPNTHHISTQGRIRRIGKRRQNLYFTCALKSKSILTCDWNNFHNPCMHTPEGSSQSCRTHSSAASPCDRRILQIEYGLLIKPSRRCTTTNSWNSTQQHTQTQSHPQICCKCPSRSTDTKVAVCADENFWWSRNSKSETYATGKKLYVKSTTRIESRMRKQQSSSILCASLLIVPCHTWSYSLLQRIRSCVANQLDLHALQKPQQLLSHVPRPFHATDLRHQHTDSQH